MVIVANTLTALPLDTAWAQLLVHGCVVVGSCWLYDVLGVADNRGHFHI